MTDNKRKKGLGRGLSSLLGDAPQAPEQRAPSPETMIAIDLIRPNPEQPRRTFPPREMEELAASIRQKGVLQPLLLRPDPTEPGRYQIVAGERRWRAAQAARLHEAPAVVRNLSDQEVLEAAIIENVQRADLNPMEEAAGYAQLTEKFGHTQAQLAETMGKSRSHVANMLRLLNLPEDVRTHVAEGRLSAGHARALITATDPSALARRIIADSLSVRQAEALAKQLDGAKPQKKTPRLPKKDADTRALEADLSSALGLKVSVDHKGGSGGSVRIDYKTLEELDGVCQLLSR